MSMVPDSNRKGGKSSNSAHIDYKDLCKIERVRNLPNVRGSKSLLVISVNTDTGNVEKAIVAAKDFADLDRDDINCLSAPLALKTTADTHDNSRKAIRKFKYAIAYLYFGNRPLRLSVPNVKLLSAADFRVVIRETAEKLQINRIHGIILGSLVKIVGAATNKSPLGALHPLLEMMEQCNNRIFESYEEILKAKLSTGQTRKVEVTAVGGEHYPEWVRKRLSTLSGLSLEYLSNPDLNNLCIGEYLYPAKLSPYLLTNECLTPDGIIGVDLMVAAMCPGQASLFKKENLLKYITESAVVDVLKFYKDFNTIPADAGKFEGKLRMPNPFRKGGEYFSAVFTAAETFPKGVRQERESDLQIMIGFSNAMRKTYGFTDRVFGENLTKLYNEMWAGADGLPIKTLGLQNPLTSKQGYESQFKLALSMNNNTLLPSAMAAAVTPAVIAILRAPLPKQFYADVSSEVYSNCRFFNVDRCKDIEVGGMLHACFADVKGASESYGFKKSEETGTIQVTIRKSGKSKSKVSAFQSGGNALTKHQLSLLDQIGERENKESVRLMASRVNVESFRTWSISRAINVLYHDNGEYESDASSATSEDDIYE